MNNSRLSVKVKIKIGLLLELKLEERVRNAKELTELQEKFLNALFGEEKATMQLCVLLDMLPYKLTC